MGSYSKLSKTTSFEFDESKFIIAFEKRREDMISNLEFLKSLIAREILMYNKVDEVNNLNILKTTKDYYKVLTTFGNHLISMIKTKRLKK